MRELRIGLVLYGGVSLAVYMNGIVTELWQALRASQALRSGKAATLDGTARLYASLFEALDRSSDAVPLRVVVDALAGTSAGGVNAAVLGKAIVEGGDVRVLNDIWLDQADIGRLQAPAPLRTIFALRAGLWTLGWTRPLRRLRGTLRGYGLNTHWARDQVWSLVKNGDGRRTPLDGAYFAEKIAEALAKLCGTPPLLPSDARLDLFLTRTDFYGWPRHLPVSETYHPEPLYERSHAHVMRFQAKAGARLDDYALTYAARTTAGFPAAFAPVSTEDIKASFQRGQPGAPAPDLAGFAAVHLAEHGLAGFNPAHAWMVDGGVLDNKPFTQLSRAIERKPADREVRRVVAFIEPDPEIGIERPPEQPPAPLAVARGLYGLLRHEPIYDDLDHLRDRNALVERIRRAIAADQENAKRAVKHAIGRSINAITTPPSAGELNLWRRQTNDYAANQPLSGYPGYVVLKAERAARELAGLLCRSLGFPYESSQAYFVRQLVRRWLERARALPAPETRARGDRSGEGGALEAEAQRDLLDAFDIPYRLRRLRHLVRIANRNYGDETRETIDALKTALAEIAAAHEDDLDASAPVKARILNAFRGVTAGEINKAIIGFKNDPDGALARYGEELGAIYQALRGPYAERGARLNARTESALAAALAALPERPRRALLRAFLIFPFVDLIGFPLMDAAGLEDLIPVDVMRISPADATVLSSDPYRLKSRGLGAFMGFLRRPAREHDLMWGRLDGAERLIGLFVKAASKTPEISPALEALAAQSRRNVTRAILVEERARPGSTLGSTINDLETRLLDS